MLRAAIQFLILVWSSIIALPMAASAAPMTGVWETVSDRTGEAEALVRITETRGHLEGTVEKIFSPPALSPHPVCENCEGDLRNKPVVGLVILRATMTTSPDRAEGEILDPDEGQVYQCKLHLVPGGERLEVRGYIGFELFGRTQIWHRR